MAAPSRAVRRAGKAVTNKPSPTAGTADGSEPISIRTGYVVTVDGTSPPSCTVTIGASQMPVPGVRLLDSYTPSGGDEVKIIRVGDDRWILGALAV